MAANHKQGSISSSGTWRIHDKIIPDWTPPREPSRLTKVQEEVEDLEITEEVEKKEEPKQLE